MIPLNFHHLYYFYAVSRAGTISKACETLMVAQPTVSAQIKELEGQLGRPLFQRSGQRLHLTEEGRFVLDYAESIFSLGQELKDSLRDMSAKGKLSVQIGIMTGLPRALAHALTEAALSTRPGTRVISREGSLNELARQVQDHQLDLAISDSRYSGPDRDRFLIRLAANIPVVFAAAPTLAGLIRKKRLKISEIPWILPAAPSQVHDQMLERFDSWGFFPDIIAETADVEIARRLAISGRGVAVLNELSLTASATPSQLTRVLPAKSLGLWEPVYLMIARRKWTNPVADRLFREFSPGPR